MSRLDGSPIRVQLIGGLGNQLFGYAAGAALALDLGRHLELDTSWTRYGMTDHGIAIQEFDLPGNWLSDKRLMTRVLPPGSVRGRFGQKITSSFGRFPRQTSIFYWKTGDSLTDVLRKQPRYLRGYFQHISFVNYLEEFDKPMDFTIRRPSRRFLELSSHVRDERPIAIHVRMGDYRQLGFGYRLSPSYYANALDQVLTLKDLRQIWLFSDEPSQAIYEIPILAQIRNRLMVVPSSLTPAETLVILRNTSTKILSNSTFSWWGAIHTNSPAIYVPTPWNLHQEPISLLPPDWTGVPATFQ